LVIRLNVELLPTFGSPTMPILRWDENLPRMGFVTTSSFFLGGMVSRIYWIRLSGV